MRFLIFYLPILGFLSVLNSLNFIPVYRKKYKQTILVLEQTRAVAGTQFWSYKQTRAVADGMSKDSLIRSEIFLQLIRNTIPP